MEQLNQERLKQIKQLWKKFIQGDNIENTELLPPAILSSWKRCRQKGVDPFIKKSSFVLEGKQLERLLAKNKELISTSLPFMKNLANIVKNTDFVVALFDKSGYLLVIVGDPNTLKTIKRGNAVVGALWNEEFTGTNGAGTVLEAGKPVQVYAYEHYCITGHKWTCSAAPIHNIDAVLIGGINMIGPYDKANPHTLGMVVAAAYAIENAIGLNKALLETQIAYGFQNEVINSIPEALIGIDEQGIILLANESTKFIFQMPHEQILGSNLKDFLQDEKNRPLLKRIFSNEVFTDAEVNIYLDNTPLAYTLTCNPIRSPERKIIGRIITLNEIKRLKSLVTKVIGAHANFEFKDIVGAEPVLSNSIQLAKMGSKSDSNMLLLGESGTGKDIFAQAIHNHSDRKNKPYVAVNCAAIPRDLISSEFFGYADGAFTGSKKGGNQGKFEIADKGSIFLDEIGEMPLDLQTNLLRVIEEKAVTRIGGKHSIPVNVRIIAATNKNLKEEVSKGNFREDLYYRINVITIEIPPLRRRKNDIPMLVDYFIKRFSKRMNRRITGPDSAVMKVFMEYSWPGNVRELQNIIERMISITPSNTLTLDLLPPEFFGNTTEDNLEREFLSIDEMEKRTILEMLRSNMPKSKIAKKLNISRSTLYRKIDKYIIS